MGYVWGSLNVACGMSHFKFVQNDANFVIRATSDPDEFSGWWFKF